MAQLVLQQPWLLLILLAVWLLLIGLAWWRRFRPFGPFVLRLCIAVLVTLALARPVYLPAATAAEEPPPRQVILVDQSASLGQAGGLALQAEAARLARAAPGALTLYFAGRPLLLPVASELSLDPEMTDLARALSLGAELLNAQPGRLALLSDGLPTTGDTPAAVAELARQGIAIDVLIPTEAQLQSWTGRQDEIRLVKLELPPLLRQGESFAIEITLHALAATEATLQLTRNSPETALAEDVVALTPGFNLLSFEARADALGLQTFRATLAAAADGQPLNNSLSAFTQVFPPPRILLVGDEPVPTFRFASQLEQAGFSVDRIGAAGLTDRLPELEPYAGLVLHNVPAGALQLEQMLAVQEFVRSLGRGLLVTGGRESYSLGGYEDTPLAELLPLSLEPPPRAERPPVALLLIIDHSGSMVENRDGPTKLAMAKEAAIRATNILGPEDLIGVLMFDNRYEWVVPFQQVSDGAALLEIQRAIAIIPGGGGTRILQALEVSLPELAAQEINRAARHAVLLTDGKSFDGLQGIEAYDRVVEQAREAGITLSAIAIGEGADQDLLSRLSELGLGRYHFAATPEELPELTIAESDILRSNALQEGEFRPSVFKPHPLLRGLFSAAAQERLPGLSSYIAMTPKPRAEVALQAGPGDPLLAVWGYGLGRVAAWTSDSGAEWAGDLSTWPEISRFWGQVIGYTLPEPDLGLLQVSTRLEADNVVTLIAEGVTAAGQPVDLAPTEALLTTPGGREISLLLRQVSPGRYEQRLRLPDPGAYRLSVTQRRGAEPAESVTSGLVIPYPAEYAWPEDGAGVALLRQIATATGGQTFNLGESLGAKDAAAAGVAPEPQELWPWLLQAALGLWPVEIAWRRWSRLRIQ
ncbi:MAG: VWA domain-containing protein [Chloroflexota bacterium]